MNAELCSTRIRKISKRLEEARAQLHRAIEDHDREDQEHVARLLQMHALELQALADLITQEHHAW